MATKKYTIQEMAKAYLDKDMAVIADIGRKHPLASYQLANMNVAGLEAIAVIPTKVLGKKLELGLKGMHNIGDVDLEDDGDEPAEEVEEEAGKREVGEGLDGVIAALSEMIDEKAARGAK